MQGHVPVMLREVLELLNLRPGARVVDGTLGQGGHAEGILEEIGPGGELLGLDRDPEALESARQRLARFGAACRLVRARLSSLASVVRASGRGEVDGVLMDLGLSSVQLDDPARGFRFTRAEGSVPLDMRMDRSRGESAAELLARLDEPGLAAVLRQGGVPAPRRVARALCARRPIGTAAELVEALEGVRLPRRRHHPATLVFQALRMAVNDELAELEQGLEGAVDVLAPGGRLAVLTYHSGEARCVLDCFAREVRGCICPPDLPRCGCGRSPRLRVLVRGRAPSPAEVSANPRARSARLRGAERW